MPGVVAIRNSAFIARFHVRPERRNEFETMFDALWRQSLDFMNAQANFVFYGWDRANRAFVAIESYKDEEMLKTLRASDVFQDKVGQLMSLCDAPMDIELFSGIEGSRAVFEQYPAGPSKVHPRVNGLGGVFL